MKTMNSEMQGEELNQLGFECNGIITLRSSIKTTCLNHSSMIKKYLNYINLSINTYSFII